MMYEYEIYAQNKRLKENIVAACLALIEFGRPNETNPEFSWGGYDFYNNGICKYVYLSFRCHDGIQKCMKITSNYCSGEIYRLIKLELK